MKIENKINFFFYLCLCFLNLMDIITTSIGIQLGAREINPIGYNYISITLKILSLLGLGIIIFMSFKKKSKKINNFLFISLIFVIIFYVFVVIHNFQIIQRLI